MSLILANCEPTSLMESHIDFTFSMMSLIISMIEKISLAMSIASMIVLASIAHPATGMHAFAAISISLSISFLSSSSALEASFSDWSATRLKPLAISFAISPSTYSPAFQPTST